MQNGQSANFFRFYLFLSMKSHLIFELLTVLHYQQSAVAFKIFSILKVVIHSEKHSIEFQKCDLNLQIGPSSKTPSIYTMIYESEFVTFSFTVFFMLLKGVEFRWYQLLLVILYDLRISLNQNKYRSYHFIDSKIGLVENY